MVQTGGTLHAVYADMIEVDLLLDGDAEQTHHRVHHLSFLYNDQLLVTAVDPSCCRVLKPMQAPCSSIILSKQCVHEFCSPETSSKK